VQGIPVSVVDPTTGQILQYDLATRQYVPVDYVGKTGGTFTGNLTLNGTANVAPNQTASSGSSLMTRDLADTRLLDFMHANVSLFQLFRLAGALRFLEQEPEEPHPTLLTYSAVPQQQAIARFIVVQTGFLCGT
jgi:hypothetical protein